MKIERNKIQEIIDNPSKKWFISKAVHYEKRLRFHGDVSVEPLSVSGACNEFLKFVETILPRDKYTIFLNLFTFPVFTNEITQKAYSQLKKVWDGKNPFIQFDFSNLTLEKDFIQYWETLGGNDSWQTESWERMVSAINAISVVDLPTVQTGELPEPYYYFLDISQVLDFQEKNNEFEYLAYFKDAEKTKLVFIDSEAYRVFNVEKGKIISEEVNNPHDLGYCPARFFWSDEISYTSKLKGNPIASQLGNLDWILYYSISKRQSENSSQWPIYWAYEQQCEFRNEKTGMYCDGGIMRAATGDFQIDQNGKIQKCPACSDKRLTGPGSLIEIPVPSEDQPSLAPGVGVVNVDVAALEYSKKQLQELENNFIKNTVGVANDPLNDQAFNEMQIESSYESRLTILKELKRNFEKAQQFVLGTLARLRYGNRFKGVVCNLGTDFYLFSKSELLKMYQAAKTAGVSDIVLDNIFYQILEVEHKNNPIEFERALTLMQLEPFRHLSRAELINLHSSKPDFISEDEFLIKLNFSNFIDRFEREQMNVGQFGRLLEFDQKINLIKQTLISYARESKPGSGSAT